MAKGLRSSVKKSYRMKLRAKVFSPVEDARTARLSQKLLELAQQPRPARTEMEVDTEKGMHRPMLSTIDQGAHALGTGTEKDSKGNPEGQTAALDFHIYPMLSAVGESSRQGAGEEEASDYEGDSSYSSSFGSSESESEDGDELRKKVYCKGNAVVGADALVNDDYTTFGLYSADIDLVDDNFVFSFMQEEDYC
jgi:Protein of unknown function (DUF2423)